MPELCPVHNTPLHLQTPYLTPGGGRLMRCTAHHHDWALPPAPPLCPLHGTPLTNPQWLPTIYANVYRCTTHNHDWAISPDHEEVPVPAPVTEEQRARAVQMCLTLQQNGLFPDDRGLSADARLTQFMDRADRLAHWLATGEDAGDAPPPPLTAALARAFIHRVNPGYSALRKDNLASLLLHLCATGDLAGPEDTRWVRGF